MGWPQGSDSFDVCASCCFIITHQAAHPVNGGRTQSLGEYLYGLQLQNTRLAAQVRDTQRKLIDLQKQLIDLLRPNAQPSLPQFPPQAVNAHFGTLPQTFGSFTAPTAGFSFGTGVGTGNASGSGTGTGGLFGYSPQAGGAGQPGFPARGNTGGSFVAPAAATTNDGQFGSVPGGNNPGWSVNTGASGPFSAGAGNGGKQEFKFG